MPKIRLVRLDDADVAVGLKFGQVLDAQLLESSGGALLYLVDAPEHPEYYIRHDQAEVAS